MMGADFGFTRVNKITSSNVEGFNSHLHVEEI